MSVYLRFLSKSLSDFRACLVRSSKDDETRSDRNDDGKSLVNPKTNVLSKAYEAFVDPIDIGGSVDKKAWLLEENSDNCLQAFMYTSTSSRYGRIPSLFPSEHFARRLLDD